MRNKYRKKYLCTCWSQSQLKKDEGSVPPPVIQLLKCLQKFTTDKNRPDMKHPSDETSGYKSFRDEPSDMNRPEMKRPKTTVTQQTDRVMHLL